MVGQICLTFRFPTDMTHFRLQSLKVLYLSWYRL